MFQKYVEKKVSYLKIKRKLKNEQSKTKRQKINEIRYILYQYKSITIKRNKL